MSLAAELHQISREIREDGDIGLIAERVSLCARLAQSQELELMAFRQLEAARFAGGFMEEVVTDAAGRLVLDGGGNVIQANFGRRS
mgnify:CR=1 FL=1